MIQLADVLLDSQTLFAAEGVELPCITETQSDGWQRSRVAQCASISMGRLPPSVLFGAHHAMLAVHGEIIAERVPHDLRGRTDILAPTPVETFDHEAVILARYGFGTWGHWLGEIVPQAVAVETVFPGKHTFAIPGHGSAAYVERMRETLVFHGIDRDRIIVIPTDRPLILTNALVVSAVWSDGIPHPAVIQAMRSYAAPFRRRDRVALMRRDWKTRNIANAEEIERALIAAGFRISDAARLPFADQVELFRSAECIFGVLGSGLTGLIYAPNECRIIATAPEGWRDRFFYALAQLRNAAWREIRGPTLWNGAGLMRDAAFEVPVGQLHGELATLNVTHGQMLVLTSVHA